MEQALQINAGEEQEYEVEENSSEPAVSSGSAEDHGFSRSELLTNADEPSEKWVSLRIRDKIRNLHRLSKKYCPECNAKYDNYADLKEHYRQHFTRMFCSCGFQSADFKVVQRHQGRRNMGIPCPRGCTSVHEVDQKQYEGWAEYVGLKTRDRFPVCQPTVISRIGRRIPPRESEDNLDQQFSRTSGVRTKSPTQQLPAHRIAKSSAPPTDRR